MADVLGLVSFKTGNHGHYPALQKLRSPATPVFSLKADIRNAAHDLSGSSRFIVNSGKWLLIGKMLLLEEDPAYPKISLSLLYFETCSVLCSLAFIPFPTALMEKLGRWCSFIILKKTKLFLIKPIFKSLWQFLRRRFQVHPVLIVFSLNFKNASCPSGLFHNPF